MGMAVLVTWCQNFASAPLRGDDSQPLQKIVYAFKGIANSDGAVFGV